MNDKLPVVSVGSNGEVEFHAMNLPDGIKERDDLLERILDIVSKQRHELLDNEHGRKNEILEDLEKHVIIRGKNNVMNFLLVHEDLIPLIKQWVNEMEEAFPLAQEVCLVREYHPEGSESWLEINVRFDTAHDENHDVSKKKWYDEKFDEVYSKYDENMDWILIADISCFHEPLPDGKMLCPECGSDDWDLWNYGGFYCNDCEHFFKEGKMA